MFKNKHSRSSTKKKKQRKFNIIGCCTYNSNIGRVRQGIGMNMRLLQLYGYRETILFAFRNFWNDCKSFCIFTFKYERKEKRQYVFSV